ncbi:FAD binding domain protein [Hyaloscypha finlandica]|nr:FAD binding domain protein [Hyaloscypha finlandica]
MTVTETKVIYRDSPTYEQARVGRVFNQRRPNRYPHGVVEATCVQDITNAVQLAKSQNLRVSVRSGGHSWAAWSVRDDAILIDLGKYNFIEYDEETKIVKVSPSTTGKMLAEYLSAKDRMFGGGHCPDVGLGGFLLQGGMGWNCRNWGWACEQIAAIDVVTAEGIALNCSEQENSDLFWAARGSGPGFPAVVTAFYLKTREAFRTMKNSVFIYPLSEYKVVMDWVQKAVHECDDSIEAVAVGIIDPVTQAPAFLTSFLTFQQTEEAALASLKHVNATHPPGAIMEAPNSPTSLLNEYCTQDLANPHGHRYIAENAYIKDDADVTEVLRRAMTTLPEGSKSFTLWFSMYPCSRRELPDMALSMQSDHYMALYTVWEKEEDDERCRNWVTDVMREVERESVGAYLGDSDFQVRKTRFWAVEQGRRLMEVRRKWDPEGRVCGYLDEGDRSGVEGLENVHEWQK